MINLLPDDTKQTLQAARANVILLRYNILSLVAVGVLFLICGAFYVIMHNTQSNAMTTSNGNDAIAASYADTRKEAEEYRNNLLTASQVLSKETNYTSVVFAITRLLPEGVVLDNLSLDASSFNKQTSFTAHAKSYEKATELKQNFENSPLFSNVYFQNLTDSSSSTTSSGQNADANYPITVTLSVKITGKID